MVNICLLMLSICKQSKGHCHSIVSTLLSNHGQYAAGSWRPFTFRKQAEDIDPLTASQPAFLDVNSTLREYMQCSKVQ